MSSERRYEIFVSSTFEDLKDERRLIQEYIISQGHVPVGMELFNSGHEEQWRVIQQVIDHCDYYVLIVAGRYGTVTPRDGIGYTEKEYLYARKKKKPMIVFLMKEDAAEKLNDDKKETDNPTKLAAFRRTLLNLA